MRRLAAALPLLVAAACSLRTPPPPGADGPTIYDYQNCANCHGATGEGKRLGPPLRDLGRFWEAEGLAGFLGDPEEWVGRNERLAGLKRAYSGKMGRYDNLDLEQRRVLARWLLEL